MKVNETHIFIRNSKNTRAIEVYTADIEVVRSLITDPKPLLWCCEGVYRWFREDMIVNAARVMYDQYKSAGARRDTGLMLSWNAGYDLDAELGNAIVALAQMAGGPAKLIDPPGVKLRFAPEGQREFGGSG